MTTVYGPTYQIFLDLYSQYEELKIEFYTKKQHFEAEYLEFVKYRLTERHFATLDAFDCTLQFVNDTLDSKIQSLNKHIVILKRRLRQYTLEFSIIHATCQIESRKKLGLIHTLPKRKIPLFEYIANMKNDAPGTV